jgi:hypothetical protein
MGRLSGAAIRNAITQSRATHYRARAVQMRQMRQARHGHSECGKCGKPCARTCLHARVCACTDASACRGRRETTRAPCTHVCCTHVHVRVQARPVLCSRGCVHVLCRVSTISTRAHVCVQARARVHVCVQARPVLFPRARECMCACVRFNVLMSLNQSSARTPRTKQPLLWAGPGRAGPGRAARPDSLGKVRETARKA